MSDSKIIHIQGEQEFNNLIKEGVTFVDFWAEWCTPCKMIAPILEKLSTEWDGKIKFAKVNIEEEGNGMIAAPFGIQGIPTLILFANGEIQDRIVGAMPEPMFIDFLKRNYESLSQK